MSDAFCFLGLPGVQANLDCLRLTLELAETIVNEHLNVLPLIFSELLMTSLSYRKREVFKIELIFRSSSFSS